MWLPLLPNQPGRGLGAHQQLQSHEHEHDCTCFMPKGIVKIPAPRKTFSVLTPNLRNKVVNERTKRGQCAHLQGPHLGTFNCGSISNGWCMLSTAALNTCILEADARRSRGSAIQFMGKLRSRPIFERLAGKTHAAS